MDTLNSQVVEVAGSQMTELTVEQVEVVSGAGWEEATLGAIAGSYFGPAGAVVGAVVGYFWD